jgi:hypothetical protein
VPVRVAAASAATLAVLAAAGTAQAAAAARHATAAYAGGSPQGVVTVAFSDGNQHVGQAVFRPRRGERTIALAGTDATGAPVAFEVYQVVDEQTKEHTLIGEFCGRTNRPLPLVDDASPVAVVPVVGVCGAGPSAPTEGLVEAAFSTAR